MRPRGEIRAGVATMIGPRALVRSPLGRRLAAATLSSGAVWVAGTIATFGVGVVLARGLGPAGYGLYGTAIAVATLLAVPAQLGLPLLATREVSALRVRGRPQEAASLAWWFLAVVALASTLLAATLGLAAGALPLAPALRPALAAAAWLLPGLALSALTTGLLRGQERVVTSQLLDVLVRPLLFVAGLFACTRPLGVPAAIAAQVAAATLVTLAGFALFFDQAPRLPARGQHQLRTWTAAALPMTLLEAMRTLEGSYGVLLAGYFASIADAGLFRVALASAAAAQVPISLQNIVVGPFLAAAHAAGERGRLARIVAASTLFASATVGLAVLAAALLGDRLLALAFGVRFVGAYWPLLVLCCNQLLAAALGPTVMLLSMTGGERAVASGFTASVLAALAAACVLTPLYGAVGTAASTLVATAVRGVVLNRAAWRSLAIAPSLAGAVRLLTGGARPRAAPLGRGELPG